MSKETPKVPEQELLLQKKESMTSTERRESKFTPFVLLIGLGTHALFEGLALGMTSDYNSLV